MLHKLYQKQVEAWKERFVNNRREDGEDFDAPPYPSLRDNCILSARHKDTIELIEAIIKEVEGRKADIRKEYKETPTELHNELEVAQQIGKMEALSDLLTKLQAEKELIENEK